jgi:pyrimidine-nucleoside phosphorylase/thymidine phosphorylase
MNVADHRRIVAAKRDGKALAPAEVEGFVQAYADEGIPDPLAAAFLMAAVIRGLDPEETLAMTRAMVASGDTVSFSGIDRPTVDKHSTGGVADGVTLVFAPLAAALGLGVAKLSGRGLGHTGGTLDKLESIPGLRTDLSPEEIDRQVAEVGCAVAAQSPRLVPADGRLYALRDATETVPSIPLIAASVMSKKLAVATDLILLDVKSGSGAFMKTTAHAERLALACLELARGWGRRAAVAVTDMDQPLGDAVGNALDVAEAVAVLQGEHRGRLRDLVVAFAARALGSLTGVGRAEATSRAEGALDAGAALDRFARMVEAQGGDPRVAEDPWAVLPAAAVRRPIEVPAGGVVAGIEAEDLGRASVALGAGRLRKGDPIDPSVGIVVTAKIGDRLAAGASVGTVHARTETDAERAAAATIAAIHLTEGEVSAPPLVHGWFDDEG